MRIYIKKSFFILLFLFAAACVFADAVLSEEVLDTVLSSVFEVLVDKMPEEGIEYERDLPLSRIAFSIRSDKYSPIGTAFLMDDGCFYSAAHVFNINEDSFYKKHYIRDRNGTVYPVKDVTLYASDRDFISFTVEGFEVPEGAGLHRAEEKINIPVFSVGNALGDGIVIRNGLLTSKTKEDRAGAWDWLRFSAAASPGNSGGPLITPEGKVLGIICMKSQNENLNYALPFTEVLLAPEDTGFFMNEINYELPEISYDKWYYRYEKEFPLPQSLEDIQNWLVKDYAEFVATAAHDRKLMFMPGGKRGFDQVPETADTIANSASYSFPLILISNRKDHWDYVSPTNLYTTKLRDEGYIKWGQMLTINFAMLEKPESQSLRDLLSSHKEYMDTLITAVKFNRTIDTESISITSFGEPASSDTYVDYFGRTWLVDVFSVPFADKSLVSFTLPTPSGLVNFMRLFDNRNLICGVFDDMRLTADLMYIHYTATFDEWEEYLALAEEGLFDLPSCFDGFSISKDTAGYTLETEEFRLDVPVAIQVPDETTDIIVYPRYEFDNGKLINKPRFFEILPTTRGSDYSYISVYSYPENLPGASKSTVQSWTRINTEVAPYNGVPYNKDNYTYMNRVIRLDYTEKRVIIMGYELLGQNRDEDISSFADAIESGLTIKGNK